VESARARLERLIAELNPTDKSTVADKPVLRVDLKIERPHLTMIGRIRRSTEIKLLEQIKESTDDAVNALNEFWQNERGTRASQRLKKADDIFRHGTGSSWVEAEVMFLEIISEYGNSWVEPLHRLAMLYYLEGRHAEARELEEFVLENKPWHVGALSHYVRVVEAQEDVETAVMWASRRLSPRLGMRRKTWADRAIKKALDQLAEEEARLKNLFGDLNSATEDLPWQ